MSAGCGVGKTETLNTGQPSPGLVQPLTVVADGSTPTPLPPPPFGKSVSSHNSRCRLWNSRCPPETSKVTCNVHFRDVYLAINIIGALLYFTCIQRGFPFTKISISLAISVCTLIAIDDFNFVLDSLPTIIKHFLCDQIHRGEIKETRKDRQR